MITAIRIGWDDLPNPAAVRFGEWLEIDTHGVWFRGLVIDVDETGVTVEQRPGRASPRAAK